MSDDKHDLYTLKRRWMENKVFAKQAYTEREAWIWIVENAFWKPGIVNIGGRPVKLQRGQLSHSIRLMGDLWKWKKDKVSRYLKKLELWEMIETVTETGQTIITVCNYNKYQLDPRQERDTTETPARQERDRSATNKNTDNTVIDDDDYIPAQDPEPDPVSHISVGKKIWEITGWVNDVNKFPNYSRIQQWLADGWDPELDIYPTVRQIINNRGSPPNSIAYFEQAIADAYAYRTRPTPKGNPNANTRTGGKPNRPTVADIVAANHAEIEAEYAYDDSNDVRPMLRGPECVRQDH